VVAIGSLDTHPEIQLEIAEFAGTGRALKALAAISRAFHIIVGISVTPISAIRHRYWNIQPGV